MIYISFDLNISKLEKYYDKTPNNAYTVVKNFLRDNGFVSYKDTNYVSDLCTEFEATQLLADFGEKHKWFPHCLTKLHVMEVVKDWDYLAEFSKTADYDFKKSIDDKALNLKIEKESISEKISRIHSENTGRTYEKEINKTKEKRER